MTVPRWVIVFVIVCGAIFAADAALHAWLRDVPWGRGVRGVATFFLLGGYFGLVIIGNDQDPPEPARTGSFRRRRAAEWQLPWWLQIVLALLVANVIAAIWGSGIHDHALASAVGFVAGATAHWWAPHVPSL